VPHAPSPRPIRVRRWSTGGLSADYADPHGIDIEAAAHASGIPAEGRVRSAAAPIALVLVDELRASGRITTVEAEALRAAVQPFDPIADTVIDPAHPIDAVIRMGGGVNKIAKALGISHQAVLQWTRCPPRRVLAIERITGVPRHALRPDLYPVPDRPQDSPELGRRAVDHRQLDS